MTKNIHPIDQRRLKATEQLDPELRKEFGQYLTPWNIASFMASMFSSGDHEVVLDAGAGIGSLSLAFLEHYPHSKIEAWEIDTKLREYLSSLLPKNKSNIHNSDFIEQAVNIIQFEPQRKFTRAILNPPYKKINSNGKHRGLLRQVGIETVNLYSAFISLSIHLMHKYGEIVAIIPRSFCNGPYYRSFRELILSTCSIEHIHIFKSRTNAFKDDAVLQENIIIKLIRGAKQKSVIISHSNDATFQDYAQENISFNMIVKPSDEQLFIHIPTSSNEKDTEHTLFRETLKEIGVQVSTGPVVDFRMKEFCSSKLKDGMVPLLYAHNFKNGVFTYPVISKKPSAIELNQMTRKWLMPNGFYVTTKRFSSKEEKKRIVAFVYDPNNFKSEHIGFENHLNVFHHDKAGMDKELAYGLYAFLNSSCVDDYFRIFSGHTQVNATDLRNMKYPSQTKLKSLGKNVIKFLSTKSSSLTQKQIDRLVMKVH